MASITTYHNYGCYYYWRLRWQSVCLQCGRPGFDPWVGKILWRRKWQPTPVLLPGKFHGRSLVGHSPWGCRVGHYWATLLLSMLLNGDGYQNPTKGGNTDYWFYIFEMEGAEKKSTISLKLWWQNQYHSQRVRAPAVALRLIILPFQAGRMCLPLLNVAKHPQPSYSERCCQGMAAVADWHSISLSPE